MKTSSLLPILLASCISVISCNENSRTTQKDVNLEIPAPPVIRPNEAIAYLAEQVDSGKYFFASREELKWWTEGRFGVFMHWNPPASIAGVPMSWGREGIRPGFSNTIVVRADGCPAETYDQLYKQFNPTNFNADEWVRMIKEAGAKYYVFTAKHHDGFCMFDSKYTDYDIMSTPYGKDICLELAEACERHDIKLLWYYSQPDWTHPDYETERHGDYIKYMHNQLLELIDYPGVDGIWFDGLGRHPDRWNAPAIVKAIREKRPGMLINARTAPREWRFGDWDTPEQEIGAFQIDRPWETCLTMGMLWSYVPPEKSRTLPLQVCLRSLARCAGGDGNLLLNTGPGPDGIIREPEKENYLNMGKWLAKYGESIYSTRGGPFLPGLWGASTRTAEAIYLHVLKVWPNGKLLLPDPGLKIKSIEVLTGGDATYKLKHGILEIYVNPKYHDNTNTLIKLNIHGNPLKLEPIHIQEKPSILLDEQVSFSASSEQANYPLDHIKRNVSEFQEGKHHKIAWKFLESDKNPWIEIDFGGTKTFSQVSIQEVFGWTHLVDGFSLEYQDPKGKWTNIATRDYMGNASFEFNPTEANKLRLNMKAAPGGVSSILAFDVY